MNTLNSKVNESNRFIYQFTEKLNLKNPNKNIALANLRIIIHGKTLNLNTTKTNFECIIKKHETIADNPLVQIYVNKIKNRIVFKIKTGYKLELLTEETMQLLGSSKTVIDKNKDGEMVPRLQTVEVVLVHCNLVNNNINKQLKCYLSLCQTNNLVN